MGVRCTRIYADMCVNIQQCMMIYNNSMTMEERSGDFWRGSHLIKHNVSVITAAGVLQHLIVGDLYNYIGPYIFTHNRRFQEELPQSLGRNEVDCCRFRVTYPEVHTYSAQRTSALDSMEHINTAANLRQWASRSFQGRLALEEVGDGNARSQHDCLRC